VNRLREIRRREGRSVAWVADQIGTSRQTIYNLEIGESRGSIETWIRLAEVLDTTVEELTEGMLEPAGKAIAG
jgi:DNA-binding XRE family transcriptional regulator